MLESLNQYQFIITALSLLILYLVLRRILFKPVTEFMENRTRSIEDAIKDAERQKKEAGEMKRTQEKQLHEARAQGKTIIDEAVSKAQREADRLVDDAKKQAQGILESAQKETEREWEKLRRQIRNETVSLALAAASKVLEENMDTQDNRALVEKFLDETGVA